MKDIIITCDTCSEQYIGEYYEAEEKKGQHGKYHEVTYQSHCTICDKPVFTTRNDT